MRESYRVLGVYIIIDVLEGIFFARCTNYIRISGQTGFGLFAPKQADFRPQMLTHAAGFQVLGGK